MVLKTRLLIYFFRFFKNWVSVSALFCATVSSRGSSREKIFCTTSPGYTPKTPRATTSIENFKKSRKNRLFYYLAIFPNCSLFDNRYSRCIHKSYYKFKNNIDLFHVIQPWERLLYEHVTCHVSHVITDSSIFLPSFMLQFAFKVIHEYSDNKNIAISPNHYFFASKHLESGNSCRSKR